MERRVHRLEPVRRDQDPVPRLLEHALAEALRDLVVIGHENREDSGAIASARLSHAGDA